MQGADSPDRILLGVGRHPGLALAHDRAGFTLIELIIVITIMALVYSVALPQLSVKTGTEVASKLGTLAGDIRASYDMAVLNRKNYRLVFHLVSGNYWLETTDLDHVLLGDDRLNHDPTEEEEQDLQESFDEEFAEFAELAGRDVEDIEHNRTIKPTSPLLAAKERLRPAKWTKVQDREWSARSLGPLLLVQSMQCEHHKEKQTFENFEEKARAFMFFFPQGYAERCVIHVAYRKEWSIIDEKEQPYSIITDPFLGTATIETGIIDFEQQQDEDRT